MPGPEDTPEARTRLSSVGCPIFLVALFRSVRMIAPGKMADGRRGGREEAPNIDCRTKRKEKSCHSANSFTIPRALQTDERGGRMKKRGSAAAAEAEEGTGGNSIPLGVQRVVRCLRRQHGIGR